MMVKERRILFFIAGLIAIFLVITTYQSQNISKRISAVGDPDILRQNYEKWKQQTGNQDGTNGFTLSLLSPNTHSTSRGGPHGTIHFDFETNTVAAYAYGLSEEVSFDMWVTNGARLFSTNEADVSLRRVGRFHAEQDHAILRASITDLLNEGFEIDQVVVAPADSNPLQSGVLAASPTLFQRLYAAEKKASGESVAFGIIGVAQASVPTGFPGVFNDLVTQGEDLFFNETFNGNGRSCGTCHSATNNFTIDQAFIASLPADDPLFVAEFVPALTFGDPANLDSNGRPQRFENPALMRSFDLIVENVDGMGDLENRFTMRGVPHNIGMTVSIATPLNGLTPPEDRTGWSGEGAPSGIVGGIPVSGRLRDFIVGAIVQHYPLTMARSFDGPDPDFRAPTSEELDALEAFLFSLGRQQELELREGFPGELVLKDAGAEAGKLLFRDGVAGSGTCQGCHGNAGANVLPNDPVNPTNNFGNRNFNTGVELFLRNRLSDPNFTVVGEPRPVDGGFGTNPDGDFTSLVAQAGFDNENFGNQSFNTPSIVEAADTPPFFHNNIIDNLEDSIRFYNSPEFMDPEGDGNINRSGIPFDDIQVGQVANFLRVINALDNIENAALRSSDRALQALILDPNADDVIQRILQIAIADTEDAAQVLTEGGLHNSGGLPINAVKQLNKAIQRFQLAMNVAASDVARSNHIEKAKVHLNNAITIMRF